VTGVCVSCSEVRVLEIGVLGLLGLSVLAGNKGVAWLGGIETPDAPDAMFFTFQTVTPSLQEKKDSK
jgi:hypothetical protein